MVFFCSSSSKHMVLFPWGKSCFEKKNHKNRSEAVLFLKNGSFQEKQLLPQRHNRAVPFFSERNSRKQRFLWFVPIRNEPLFFNGASSETNRVQRKSVLSGSCGSFEEWFVQEDGSFLKPQKTAVLGARSEKNNISRRRTPKEEPMLLLGFFFFRAAALQFQKRTIVVSRKEKLLENKRFLGTNHKNPWFLFKEKLLEKKWWDSKRRCRSKKSC